jgi:RNA polymerase sigma-70 factor (ECF subfamily)
MGIKTNLTVKGKRDYKLIQKALNEGDQKAYAELLQYYRDPLYFRMLKITKNPDDAEDLTIEAFAKAFKSLKQYTPDYAFSTWLFAIATNHAIDFTRNQNRDTLTNKNGRGDKHEKNQHSKTVSGAPDPEELFIRSQKVDMIHEVVDKLKPHYKKLIELRYFKEYSYEEIVQELALPLGTIKAQLFRARELLYNILINAKEQP